MYRFRVSTSVLVTITDNDFRLTIRNRPDGRPSGRNLFDETDNVSS
jgi:hypothetical protein